MKEPEKQIISVSTWTMLKAVGIVLGLWFVWYIQELVVLMLISVLLAALISPFADWLAKRRMPRGLAVLVVYGGFLGIVALIVALVVPVVVEQSSQLLENLSLLSSEIAIEGRVESLIDEYGYQEGVRTVRGVFEVVVALFVVSVLTFYMVVEKRSVTAFVAPLVPQKHKARVSKILLQIQDKIGAWLRGQLILGLIVGLAVYLGLSLLGVPYALLLAVVAALFEIIPYIGPVLALIPAALIGFSLSIPTGFLVVILYLVIQQLENNILVPKVMQKVTGLNPLVSLIALLIGARLYGLAGAFLAIPLVMMGTVFVQEFTKESP